MGQVAQLDNYCRLSRSARRGLRGHVQHAWPLAAGRLVGVLAVGLGVDQFGPHLVHLGGLLCPVESASPRDVLRSLRRNGTHEAEDAGRHHRIHQTIENRLALVAGLVIRPGFGPHVVHLGGFGGLAAVRLDGSAARWEWAGTRPALRGRTFRRSGGQSEARSPCRAHAALASSWPALWIGSPSW